MAWENSNRRERLPSDWDARRVKVFTSAGWTCEHVDSRGVRCSDKAREVDHIQRGDDHNYANLQALCTWHHAEKTNGEAIEARRLAAKERKEEDRMSHPGMALKAPRKPL